MINKLFQRSELKDILAKVDAGKRITDAECLRLFRSHDLAAIGHMANLVRERKNGNVAYYILNRHINYSNLCIFDCDFCAFYRRRHDSGAYEYSIAEMVAKAQEALKLGVTELHIVGGVHPSFKWEHYIEMLRSLKALNPQLHLKAFTAVEILHLARISKRSVPETLAALREAGLGSLTGGGAEIFDPEVRKTICHAKESAEEWLDVHRTWHKMGGRSTCTMLIGHVEKEHHRVDHLRRLRELQDETGGFTAFVTLAFHPENTKLAHLPGPSGYDLLKTLAIARIYLDNVYHIRAYWILMGLKLAQVSLSFGVDDLDGTVIEEKVYHMAGAKTPQEMTCKELVRTIREAGREPVRRDSLYRTLEINHRGTEVVETGSGALSERALPRASIYAGASNEGGAA